MVDGPRTHRASLRFRLRPCRGAVDQHIVPDGPHGHVRQLHGMRQGRAGDGGPPAAAEQRRHIPVHLVHQAVLKCLAQQDAAAAVRLAKESSSWACQSVCSMLLRLLSKLMRPGRSLPCLAVEGFWSMTAHSTFRFGNFWSPALRRTMALRPSATRTRVFEGIFIGSPFVCA